MTPAERLSRLVAQLTNSGEVPTTMMSGVGPGGPHGHNEYAGADHTHAEGGAHPDATAHVALGLSGSAHNHDGAYAPPHGHPYEASGAVSTHAATPHGSGATLSTVTVGASHAIAVTTTDHDLTLTQACTFSFTGTPPVPAYLTVTLRGTQTVTWPGSVIWQNGIPAIAGVTLVVLYNPGGGTWYGSTPTHGHPYEASGAVATHAATPHGGSSNQEAYFAFVALADAHAI